MISPQIYKTIIIVLAILNIALVMILLIGPPDKAMPPEPLVETIGNKLGFNESQMAVYRELANDHRKGIDSLDNRHRQLMDQYLDNLSGVENSNDLQQTIDKMMQIESEKLKITYGHFMKLKGICNQEQKGKFPEIMEELRRIMLPPKPMGRRP